MFGPMQTFRGGYECPWPDARNRPTGDLQHDSAASSLRESGSSGSALSSRKRPEQRKSQNRNSGFWSRKSSAVEKCDVAIPPTAQVLFGIPIGESVQERLQRWESFGHSDSVTNLRDLEVSVESAKDESSPFVKTIEIWQERPFSMPSPILNRRLILDTGCHGGNWVSADIIAELGVEPRQLSEEIQFRAFNGELVSTAMEATLHFRYVNGSKTFGAVFYIYSGNISTFDVVVGAGFCNEHKAIFQEPGFNGLMPARQTRAEKEREREREAEHKAEKDRHKKDKQEKEERRRKEKEKESKRYKS